MNNTVDEHNKKKLVLVVLCLSDTSNSTIKEREFLFLKHNLNIIHLKDS
jgi:hypothetical protein